MIRDQVVNALRARSRAHGWQGVLLVSPENVAYVAGFVVPSQPLLRWRHAVCVVPVTGDLRMIVVDMEGSTVRKLLPDVALDTYDEFEDEPMAHVAKVVHELGWTTGAVGIEMDYLPAASFRFLSELLPDVTWAACDAELASARMRKTSDEIEILRTLSRVTDTAIRDAFSSVSAGMSEMDIAANVVRRLYEQGVDGFKMLIVASGERSALPNVGPTNRILCEGDLIRTEVFGVRSGYHAGVCRTAVVGEATKEFRRLWTLLVECREVVMDGLRVGADSVTIYESFLRVFTRTGHKPISFVGHGIGLFLHEEPYLGRRHRSQIESGMVLGIEPLIYADTFGLQTKDMVLVTEEGCELLSDVTPAHELVRIKS